MTIRSVSYLKTFVNANRTSNGTNSNTGATENELWIDIIDSFFSVLSTPAVTGSGTTNYITRWASSSVAQAGTWTNTSNALSPVNNNSALGTSSLGVQMFGAAATTTTAPVNLKTSAGVIPTGVNRLEGMLLWDGTSLLFHNVANAAGINLLASATLTGSGTTNTMPLFTASGVIGDSYMTQTAAGTALLTKNLGIGVAASSSTGLYMDSIALEFPVYIDAAYVGGNDHNAGFFSAGGINAANNTAIYGTSVNGDKNIGVHGVSSAVSNESIGVIGHSGALPTTAWESFATTNNLESVGGMFISAWGNTANGAAIAGRATGSTSGDNFGLDLVVSNGGAGSAYAARLQDGSEGIGKVLTCVTADGKAQWSDSNPVIIGGVTLSSSSNTNILNGTYVILADTTTATSVTSGIGQDSNWTLEVTQAGITNQKGVVTFTGNLEKDGGGGANYDVAIFKNGSIVSESEQIDQKLESDGKGQSVTVMAIIEFSTSDTFDIRVAGNGTANDIFCGGGSLYIQ